MRREGRRKRVKEERRERFFFLQLQIVYCVLKKSLVLIKFDETS